MRAGHKTKSRRKSDGPQGRSRVVEQSYTDAASEVKSTADQRSQTNKNPLLEALRLPSLEHKTSLN